MENWNNLKTAISSVVKSNGIQGITGDSLQSVMLNMVTKLGENYMFAGVATPATTPGTPDGNVFYFAVQAGTYVNFGGLEIKGGFNIIKNNTSGDWVLSNVYELTDELGDSETAIISQKAVTNELGAKANHGYDAEETPKTLKEVDDNLVQLAGDVSSINTVIKAPTGVFNREDLLKYPALALFKSIEVSSSNYDLELPSSISLMQIYRGIGDAINNLYIIFNINELNNGTIYNQSCVLIFDIEDNPTEISGTKIFSSPFNHISIKVVFNYEEYLPTMDIQNAQIEKNGLIKLRSQFLNFSFDFGKVENDLIQAKAGIEINKEDIKKHYVGLGRENFFSKFDIVEYPALRLFKKVEITGLQREVDKINTLSLVAVHRTPSNDQLIFEFNVNGVNNGTRWENSYGITVDTTSIPDIITATSNRGSAAQKMFNTRMHIEFDYSAFDWSTMNINFTSISPDRRVFLTEDFIQNMKLEPNTIAGGTQLAKVNRRAILGELPFYKKDYIDVDILQHFYDLKITNVKEDLMSLSITNLSVTGGKLQLIINQNNRTSGGIWHQSIVINADIPSDGNEVIFSGFSSRCNFEVKLNLAEWDRDILLSEWVLYAGQYIADDKAIHILPEYIEKLKRGDTIKGVYSSFGELANDVTEIGQEARLGGLLYERIALGATEKAFRRNFSYKIPKNDTLKVVDVAARTRPTYTMDITEGGVIRGLEPDLRYITYFNSFEEMKSYPPSDVGNILYDLRAMNAEFKGVLRYWWQLNNGNILINERTEGDNIGGLWILNTVEDTLYKVFTLRNKWQFITNGGWSIDFAGDTIYLSEYGNSPIESGIGIKADATKLWKSEDFGETWVEVYDFKNIPGVMATGLHIHSVHYDKTWDRLWVTTGDLADETGSSKMLLWSDDRGDSWSKLDLMEYWGSPSNPLNSAQGLSMYSTENFLLIGSDDFQNCIYRVAKVSKNDTPKIEIVYRYNPIYNDRITQYTARWQRLSNGMIVVALINGDHFPRRNRIMGTFDGLKWYELWSNAETSDHWYSDGVLIEHEGHLYLQIRGITPNTDSVAHNLIKFKLDTSFI